GAPVPTSEGSRRGCRRVEPGRLVIALPRSRRIAAVVVIAFVALELGYAIWAAFVAHGPLGPRVGYGPDSAVYIASARAPLWSRRFLAGPGPFGFLLVAKVAARNLPAIVIVQAVVATVALLVAIRPTWRRRGLTIGIAALAFTLAASALSNAADPPRWYWPIGETVSIRLLADPGATRYLVAHGFPLDDATRDLPEQ